MIWQIKGLHLSLSHYSVCSSPHKIKYMYLHFPSGQSQRAGQPLPFLHLLEQLMNIPFFVWWCTSNQVLINRQISNRDSTLYQFVISSGCGCFTRFHNNSSLAISMVSFTCKCGWFMTLTTLRGNGSFTLYSVAMLCTCM